MTSTRRLRLMRAIAMLLFIGFTGRLFWMQVVQGSATAAEAIAKSTFTSEIPAVRGQIQDVTGLPLAVTIDARNITADQTLIRDPKVTAELLAPVIGADPVELQQTLTGTRRFVYVAKEVSPQLWKEVENLNLSGILSESASRRVYPQGELAANVIGFLNSAGRGGGGIEYSYNTVLAGKPGRAVYTMAGGATRIRTGSQEIVHPQSGTSVRLTIDRDVQWIAQRAIADKVKYANADHGTVVVIDTTNGHIVAMATAPSFNPNDVRRADPELLGNPIVSTVYEPGSTQKVLTMSAVIEEGAAAPDTKFVIPPRLGWKGVKSFKDHTPHGTLKLTLTGILAQSSNIGTIKAATRIGEDKLFEYLQKFGFGAKTGSGLAGESGGILPALNEWSVTTFPTVAFGQGVSVTALQAAQVYQTIANKGVRITPTVIAGTVNELGEFVPNTEQQRTTVISESTAKQVLAMMESVVSDQGTAPGAAIPGYRVAGKTGTANRVDDSCGCYRGYVASFIGVAPADKPRFVVAVALTNPRNGHYGGVLGGPVFKEVMTFALQKYRVPPSGDKRPVMPTTWK